MTRRWHKARDRAGVRLRPRRRPNLPDPPMAPSVALRRCEKARTIAEVRAIVGQFLDPKE